MSLMTSIPRVGRIRRYLLAAAAILLLSLCAGVNGWFTQSVAAKTSNPSTQSDSADKKAQKAGPDLDCTYYDKGVPHPGTCGFDPKDKTKYRCYLNADLTKSQMQIGCQSKVLKAMGEKK